MLIRSLALAALVALPLPAFAQETPTVDHVAAIIMGVKDGSHAYMGKDNLATANRSAPGVFDITNAEGAKIGLVVTEVEPCVFDLAISVPGRASPQLLFYAGKLSDVIHRANAPDANGVALMFNDYQMEPGTLVRTNADGTITEDDISESFQTSLSVEEMDAAVDALKAACPSPGSAALSPGAISNGADFQVTTTTVDLVAKVMLGTAPGFGVAYDPAFGDRITRVSDGYFEINDGDGAPVFLKVTEIGPCVFDLDILIEDDLRGRLRLDANKLASVTYAESPGQFDMKTYDITLAGKSGVYSNVWADGSLTDAPLTTRIESSVPIADLNEAAKALRQAC